MKLTTILFALTLTGFLTLASCNGGDKGKWPQAEQDSFIENCVPGASENPEIDAEKYCNCMLEKVMDKYPEPEDSEKMTFEDITNMAEDCI